MSTPRRSHRLLGALGERLRAWTGGSAEEPAVGGGPAASKSEPTTAQRLDEALARLRDQVPAEQEPVDSGGEADARGVDRN